MSESIRPPVVLTPEILTSVGIPYFPRRIAEPAGLVEQHSFLTPAESMRAVEDSGLTDGAKSLTLGLLLHGEPARFGKSTGLDYDDLIKRRVSAKFVLPALAELAEHVTPEHDALLAPDVSAHVLSGAIADRAGSTDVLRINKLNGNGSTDKFIEAFYRGEVYAVGLQSYTKGNVDVLTLWRKSLLAHLRDYGKKFTDPINAIFADEIVDTGTIIVATYALLEQARQAGINIGFDDVLAPFVKNYTEPGAYLRSQTGWQINVHGVVGIDDMGMGNAPPVGNMPEGLSWIKIRGVDQALTFAPKISDDIPPKPPVRMGDISDQKYENFDKLI